MNRRTRVLITLLACIGCTSDPSRAQLPIIGGPCEGCEAVFEGLPTHSE